jgi:hypothetical protein
MATNHACLSYARLRADSICCGHAMSFTLLLSGITTGAKNHTGPVFIFADGSSVPILRGSPPL